MKLDQIEKNEVVSQGVQSQGNFSIKADPKAFKALSSTLYSDKIGSMIREIAFNASDSHIQANKKDLPIKITLPDAFNPEFSVEDFGLGLSEEDIYKIYSTYFESTKSDSNDAVGAFGLGSKSPFGYSDSFTIVSTYNGVRKTYVATIDDMSVSKVHEESVSEINGIKIIVGVQKKEDFSLFESKTKEQLKFMIPKPYVNGEILEVDHDDDIENFENLTDNVLGYKSSNYHSYSKLYIIQGGVGYNVDVSDLRDELNRYGFDAEADDLYTVWNNYRHVAINCPIGDIAISLSRENIELVEHSINNIAKQLREISAYSSNMYVETMNDNDLSMVDKITTLHNNPFTKRLLLAEMRDCSAKGDDKFNFLTDDSINISHMRTAKLSGDNHKNYDLLRKFIFSVVKSSSLVRGYRHITDHVSINLDELKDLEIYLRCASKPFVRIKSLISGGLDKILLVEHIGADKDLEKDIKDLEKLMFNKEVKDLEEVDAPKNSVATQKRYNVKILGTGSHISMFSTWETENITIEDIDGVVFEIERNDLADHSEWKYREAIGNLHDDGFVNTKIYALNKRNYEKLLNSENTDWETPKAYVARKTKKFRKFAKLIAKVDFMSSLVSKSRNCSRMKLIKIAMEGTNKIDSIKPDASKKIVNYYKQVEKIKDALEKLKCSVQWGKASTARKYLRDLPEHKQKSKACLAVEEYIASEDLKVLNLIDLDSWWCKTKHLKRVVEVINKVGE